MIKIKQKQADDPMAFSVTVADERGESHYEVTLTDKMFRELTVADATAEQCIEAAFEFLLDREPREAILPTFDVTLIASYFPEFKTAFMDYLNRVRA